MDVAAAQAFFSFLALVAGAGAIVMAVAIVLTRRVRAAEELVAAFAPLALPLSWLVAATAMAGSLYFSEVANYQPCTLCWYQRICMYSLAIVLLVALVARRTDVRAYAVTLAAIGLAISTYHYLLEWNPQWESTDVCSVTTPCTTIWFRRFGFVTLPFMALTAFATVIVMTAAGARARAIGPPDGEETA